MAARSELGSRPNLKSPHEWMRIFSAPAMQQPIFFSEEVYISGVREPKPGEKTSQPEADDSNIGSSPAASLEEQVTLDLIKSDERYEPQLPLGPQKVQIFIPGHRRSTISFESAQDIMRAKETGAGLYIVYNLALIRSLSQPQPTTIANAA